MKFQYQARDKVGNAKKGFIEARSAEAAIQTLQSYGLIVVDVKPVKRPSWLDNIFGQKLRVSKKDLAIFLRQFATLLESQVPLGEALKTLVLQAPSPAVKDLVFELITDLDAGLPLSKAVENKTEVFGDFYTQMIRSGEISGRLEETLSYLADYAEHENDLNSKIKAAATYPIFLIITFIIIGAVITISLAPQMVAIFDEFGATPPLASRILIGLGSFLRQYGYVIIIFIIGMTWLVSNYAHSNEGSRLIGRLILGIPVLGDIFKKTYIARFCETVGTLISGGIPSVVALEVGGGATGNYVYLSLSKDIVQGVKTGESLSSLVAKYPMYFPPLVSQMISVGEKTGRLDESLKKVSEYYRKDVESSFQTLIDLLQPILIVIIGLLVALLVSAVLLPIYQLAQSV